MPSTAALQETSPDKLIGALAETLTTLAAHLSGAVSFQTSTLLEAVTGSDVIYDGQFWKERSPIEKIDRVRVPTFVVGGLDDLFQRGEPMLYERLKQNVPARLIVGPWTHLGGSRGSDLEDHGMPSLGQIQLRWFDRFLKGRKRQTQIGKIRARPTGKQVRAATAPIATGPILRSGRRAGSSAVAAASAASAPAPMPRARRSSRTRSRASAPARPTNGPPASARRSPAPVPTTSTSRSTPPGPRRR